MHHWGACLQKEMSCWQMRVCKAREPHSLGSKRLNLLCFCIRQAQLQHVCNLPQRSIVPLRFNQTCAHTQNGTPQICWQCQKRWLAPSFEVKPDCVLELLLDHLLCVCIFMHRRNWMMHYFENQIDIFLGAGNRLPSSVFFQTLRTRHGAR